MNRKPDNTGKVIREGKGKKKKKVKRDWNLGREVIYWG
jgi:hypothetical protein